MVVLITGAGSGIGLESAVELARRGEVVVGSMRDLGRSDALLAAADQAGVDVEVAELDVTDDVSVRAAVDGVVERHGRVDVVVNNAAVWTVGALELLSDADTAAMIDTNVGGPVRVIRAVTGQMRSQGGGRIVNVGSGVADYGHGAHLIALYGATKAALRSLSFELSKELRPLGVEVVLVEGGINGKSGMWARAGQGLDSFEPDSPYREAEALATVQLGAMIEGQAGPQGAAQIIADACTVVSPAIRYPPELQISRWSEITDDEFLGLCDGADSTEIHQRHGIEFNLWPTASSTGG